MIGSENKKTSPSAALSGLFCNLHTVQRPLHFLPAGLCSDGAFSPSCPYRAVLFVIAPWFYSISYLCVFFPASLRDLKINLPILYPGLKPGAVFLRPCGTYSERFSHFQTEFLDRCIEYMKIMG